MILRNPRRLADAMEAARSSQPGVARAAGWKSHTSVRRLLSGEFESVEDTKAQAIADHLGVDIGELFMSDVPTNSARNNLGKRAA